MSVVLIEEITDLAGNLVVTSDRWHVIHAEWVPGSATATFLRTIVSEHASYAAALRSGRALKVQLARGMEQRPRESRDQVMVRRPSAETIKVAGRVSKRA